MPVVMVFHGLGMDGTSVRALSAMDYPGERNGFITVYPDAVNRRWNDGVQRCTTDDVAFVSDMLNAISRKFKIDSRRVYACGISNGGFFVQKLACELPEKIAAIGVVAATASDAVCSRCNTHRGMPIVYFIGTDDPLFPREGETKELGKLGDALGLTDLGVKSMSSTVAKFSGVMSPSEAPEFWARNNGASAHPREEVLPDSDTRDGCKVKRETYGGSSEVVVYTIEGGGHSWPGGMGFVAQDILGRTTNDINASEIMWQFFRNHSR
jgi:polyhydroxybutyrate depolymerase